MAKNGFLAPWKDIRASLYTLRNWLRIRTLHGIGPQRTRTGELRLFCTNQVDTLEQIFREVVQPWQKAVSQESTAPARCALPDVSAFPALSCVEALRIPPQQMHKLCL